MYSQLEEFEQEVSKSLDFVKYPSFNISVIVSRSDLNSTRCPACGSGSLKKSLVFPGHFVLKCHICQHRIVKFTSQDAGPSIAEHSDLHQEIESEEFLKSLLTTRKRQASLILSHIASLSNLPPNVARVVDFGCGRGVFIEEANSSRTYGSDVEIIGVDNSEIALSIAAKLGAKAFHSTVDYPHTLDPLITGSQNERPSGTDIFALDVIEHFESGDIASDLRHLTAFRDLRLFVVKVPVSNGILHRIGFALARIGIVGPLMGLLLSDSAFPHRHVFSLESLQTAAERAGFTLVSRIDDEDFEFEQLGDRAERLTGRFPKALKSALRATLNGIGRALRLIPRRDSTILILKRSESPSIY